MRGLPKEVGSGLWIVAAAGGDSSQPTGGLPLECGVDEGAGREQPIAASQGFFGDPGNHSPSPACVSGALLQADRSA